MRLGLLFSLAITGGVTLLAQLQPQEVPDLLKDAAARPPLSLDAFNGFALNSNPTLGQANAEVRRSVAQGKQAALWPNPTVGYQGEQIRGGDYGGGEQGAFVQQTVVLGGKLGLRRNVYEKARRADEIGVVEQRTRVLSDVSRHFYEALASQEAVELRKQLLKVASDAVETAHQLQNVGQADVPDVLQSEVEAEQAKVDYISAQRMFLQNFSELSALAGRPELPVAMLAGNLEQPPVIDPTAIIDKIANESPSVRRAQAEIAHAEAALKAARRESIPDLTVRAGVEQNFEHLPESTPRSVGVQAFSSASLTLPIFNRNSGNVAAAEAELERATNEVTRIKLYLRQNTQKLLQSYLTDQMQAERYRRQMIPRAQRAYELYLEKYRSMAAAYPQVLVSQRTLFQLRAAYINVLGNLWSEGIALENFTLSDGLGAPAFSKMNASELNLPNSSAN